MLRHTFTRVPSSVVPHHVRAMATASTSAPSRPRSLLDSILGRSHSNLKPLDEEWPSAVNVTPSPVTSAMAASITELSNGVRVISQPTGLASSTVGLMVAAGARHSQIPGVPQLIARLGLQTTPTRTELASTRALSELGGFSTNCQRDYISFAADVMPVDAKAALNVVQDVALNGCFDIDEVDNAVASYAAELKEGLARDVDLQIQEALHAAAFGSSPLGRPLHASADSVRDLGDPENLRAFRDNFFVSGRLVVVGAGVDHDKLVSDAEALLGGLPRVAATDSEEQKTEYVGGESRLPAASPDGFAHVALGFKCGGWHSDDVVAACALSMLMGGGGSFSAGGPGKGMYSRLYTRVLNGNAWVHSALCNTSLHGDATLFSLQGSAMPEDAGKLVAVLVREASDMKRGFSDEEVSRAKNQVKSALHMNLESRHVLFEDLGQQMLAYGRRIPPRELQEKIDALTGEDLSRVAQIMLDSNPTLVVAGDSKFMVPSHSVVSSALKKS